MKALNVCIAGATGAVGRTLIKILEENNFPVANLYPLASKKSAGLTLSFKGQDLKVIDLNQFDFKQADIGLFSAGGDISAHYAPKAAAAGCVVIDNTSYFRLHPKVPLVVAEVNPESIAEYKHKNLIANPNCSTMQMVVALKPIYDAVGITRIDVATYQAVSGSGKKAIDELMQQSQAVLDQQPTACQVYAKQIAFNCLPQIDTFTDNGFTKEEMKMVHETRKIFGDDSIHINPTAVRVPVLFGHSEAIHLETAAKISVEQAKGLLAEAAGVKLMDDPSKLIYPTALECAHKNDVLVGRVRENLNHPNGLNLWVVADNVRKGAATNAVQIAEILAAQYL